MKTVPVFLDTDIGGDIDDTWALAYLLNSPELELEYALTCTGTASYRARIIAKLLQWAGNTSAVIGYGLPPARKLDGGIGKRQAAWIEDFDLKSVPNTIREDGVAGFVQGIMACCETPTIIAIGPLVNLAAALELEPGIAGKSRIVIMGGSVRRGYFGAPEPSREYNVAFDVRASQKVFSAPWRETIVVPLDTCGYIWLDGPDYWKIRESGAPMAKAVIQNYAVWQHEEARNFPQRSSLLCDTVAVEIAFDESLFVIEDLPLAVTDEGHTVIDPERGRLCRVATDWKDLPGFKRKLTERLLKPGRVLP